MSDKINAITKLISLSNSGGSQNITPYNLVKNILNFLPKSFFCNPNVTFLDPCCGTGTLLLEIMNRLDNGLKTVIPNDDDRRLHILKNQIFSYDIDFVAIQTFKQAIKYMWKLNVNYDQILYNIKNKDFMEKGINMKFDVIVGNPPYNNKNSQGGKPWHKFTKKCFELTNNHMLFIVPTSWAYGEKREPKKIRSLVKDNLSYANLDASKYFPNVGEDISWFLIDKTQKINKTKVIVDDKEIDHYFEKKLIRQEHKEYYDLYNKIMIKNKTKFDLVSEQTKKEDLVKTRNNQFCYEVIYTAANRLWSKKCSKFQNNWKVILNRSGYYFHKQNREKYIFKTDTAMAGRLTAAVLCNNEKECDNLINYFTSKLIVVLLECNETKNTQYKDDIYLIPLVDKTIEWNDQKIYQHFSLSDEEVLLVENLYKEKFGI